ncbi:ribonuclease Z [Venenivibrio stagnispumantis]|uniref:Ribonuclease Z n=1 Tax=Venenivibrio stagnispumantis TaxID=407998 RepID=A0AA45WMA3_9AQUI|nr:ribonuclease Z [Venenivibrio stagnispumantis]MCW4572828.1 ribonuclease Z [Venenivibrio stagnispumantis]SMP13523.1 ribonuclease Z [Venenivibrio stagnispumantis]
MSSKVKHRLINDKFEDPGILIEIPTLGEYILFDIGNIYNIDKEIIKKLSKIFITHTHMDHFIGFDYMLRLKLGKPQTVEIFGINPLSYNVYSKLQGYTWNLVDLEPQIIFKVKQLNQNIYESYQFDIKKKFQKELIKIEPVKDNIIYENEYYAVKYAVLDHKIDILGYSFEYKDRLLLKKEKIQNLPLKGKEVGDFKKFLQDENNKDKYFKIGDKNYSWQELREEFSYIQKGIKISYITDVIYHEKNKEKIIQLVKDSDYLYCEAVFLERDKEQAEKVYHLTTKQTAEIAKEANVKNLIVFHFSRRYGKNKELIMNEIKKYFENVS